ncbi:hypothetical protein [Caballeronia novacaledonica]|uniref:Uncharacterized protein n=1 Tax=Caballeronia novacaledonica TaxID=1544861 RepID=A0AA37INM4_9BURK|nr:hypothetical protein [Caballeronia novacaledonica]GJH30176.1 hypothetical protein CBA19CS42_36690 [Caballeronia novacaledonica]
MKVVSFSLEEGAKYYGSIDGNRFFIGKRVPYAGGKGLMNVAGNAGQRYDRAEYREKYKFWADFIHPTAMAEGALFHTLNTYDRAHFTFSFLQFAAHVPNGDFVIYLRRLLKELPVLAKEYFPDLEIVGTRIHRVRGNSSTELENDHSTAGIIDYLNPSLAEIEDTEIIQAARFIHWVQNDAAHRALQIDVGIDNFKKAMSGYASHYKLDGADDIVCLLVADIRHQGRAHDAEIFNALKAADPASELVKLGEPRYHERLLTIKKEIKRLKDEGTLGRHRYKKDRRDFVPV